MLEENDTEVGTALADFLDSDDVSTEEKRLVEEFSGGCLQILPTEWSLQHGAVDGDTSDLVLGRLRYALIGEFRETLDQLLAAARLRATASGVNEHSVAQQMERVIEDAIETALFVTTDTHSFPTES